MIARSPRWLRLVGFGLAITVVIAMVSVGYRLISGQNPPGGALSSGIVFFFAVAYTVSKDKASEPLPPDLEASLQKYLDTHGVGDYQLAIGDKVLPQDYPIPLVLGKRIYLSPSVIRDLSPNALAWITAAEANADRRKPKYLFVILGGLVVLGLVASALFDRFNAPIGGWIALVAAFPSAFYVLIRIAHLNHLKADQFMPRSEIDLLAAKEAFSYAYFAQVDRPFLRRFNFRKGEIKSRATALGLDLERAFRSAP